MSLNDSAFTEGYRDGRDALPKRLGAPVELILLRPEEIVTWRNAYEEGFAAGKEARRTVLEWRAAERAAVEAEREQSREDER